MSFGRGSALWKWGAAVVLVLLLAALANLQSLLPPDAHSPPSPSPLATTTVSAADATRCRRCHEAVWQEWEASYHSQSFTHPDVRAAFRHFGHDRQCESCHAPEPVLPDLAAPVVLRQEQRDSGVNCLTCHALPDGQVAARRTIADAPCRPVETAALVTSEHCGRCHTSAHKEWLDSPQRTEGKTCQSCHMPTVAGRAGGRSHLCLGGHDESLVRSAAKMMVKVDGEQLRVDVTNQQAGHHFPGEKHNRLLFLQVTERAADGEITLVQQQTIKAITPFRGETSSEQIRAGQTFSTTFPIVSPAIKAEVKLLYKLFPWYPDREALVVHKTELELP